MAGRNRPSQPSVITPRAVATLVGGACLVALAWAAVESGGSIPAEGVTSPGPVGFGLVALGVLAFGTGVALRLRSPPSSGPRRKREMTLDEPEVRALLERWYPDWDPRHRARVAEAICYHRQRMGSHD